MVAFPVTRIAHIASEERGPAWLVESLWTEQAVGFVGGTPKSCKTWLALELAVAVASGVPCLGRFRVHQRGHVLLYAAEDTAGAIKHRVAGIASARRVPLEHLAVGLITTPSLQLDHPDDQERLMQTVARFKPKLLVLDPLVRLHRGDENSAADTSALLGFLRQLQREHAVAVAVVHHVRKSAASQPGQALRGSGDLHAWSDSSLYLLRRKASLELHAEHRNHPSPAPLVVELQGEPTPHLCITGSLGDDGDMTDTDLLPRVLAAVRATTMTRAALREQLGVRNETLGHALTALEAQARIHRRDGLLAVPDSVS